MSDLQEKHQAGISFDWVVVRELRFADNPTATGFGPFANAVANLNVQTTVDQPKRSCRVVMRLTLAPPVEQPDLFQSISATIEGQFSTAADHPTVDIESFAKRQASAILMPFLREAIASLTAKSRFGQVLIPPLNVVAIVEEMERSKEQVPFAAAEQPVAHPPRSGD